jgi:DNA-binding MarR family transcriptional regulator
MADAPAQAETNDVELAEHLRNAVNRLNRRLRQESLGGISPAQASMLGMADRLETPTLGELARAEQIQPPTMTRLVAQMESAGLIDRIADPNDRRICRVKVTAKGRRELHRIRTRKTAFLVERIASLDEADQLSLGRLVELLEKLGATT